MYPKVISAKAINDHELLIEFDNSIKKTYDIANLCSNEMFAPLKNFNFLQEVKVEKGGYAISWDENIDISEHELWIHGTTI